MSNNKITTSLSSILVISCLSPNLSAESLDMSGKSSKDIDGGNNLVIWGENKTVNKTDQSSSNSILEPEDMVSINATTTEDLISYEPGLVVRKRFIGDSNGTFGVRGSNMFQTSRSMVFADGVPLHYFLQTRWSGAPRWSLVSADEIAQIEVIYGPYSAEYGGNSMGGVVKIETAIPTERSFHIQGTLFSQNYDELGFDNSLNGYKGFFSYSDKIDNWSIYTSYNRLENESHPQTYRFASAGEVQDNETSVEGAIQGENEYGDPVFYYADSGPTDVVTNNYKVKVGYEFERWFALLNIAYEQRDSENNQANSYLSTESGTNIWGGRVVQNGEAFSVRESHFAESQLDRRSLLSGFRLQGELTDDWWLEADISHFKVLEDETLSSLSNPQSPAYTPAGEIREYDDTGWSTAELKLQNDSFLGNQALSFVSGIRFENYQLKINNYDSENYALGIKSELTGSSGGETTIQSLYGQLSWQMNKQVETIFGGRLEQWSSDDGFFNTEQHIDRSETRFSPKFSVNYQTGNDWQVRYSLAKAFRFPIVEELFQNERRTQGTSLANANLEPEDGFHQNLMLEKPLENGLLRFSYFHEEIDDVIFAQRAIIDNHSINTFIPIDTVETSGIEMVFNQFGLLDDTLDVRFNATYSDSEITRNSANPTLEGKVFPRMPKWRANLLATYHMSEQWTMGGGIRYASNSFGDLNNADTANNVFGAHDDYFLLNLKTTYHLTEMTQISLGIDNVNGETAYVHHPWPQRTVYLEASHNF